VADLTQEMTFPSPQKWHLARLQGASQTPVFSMDNRIPGRASPVKTHGFWGGVEY
jgi:hypothetical protein